MNPNHSFDVHLCDLLAVLETLDVLVLELVIVLVGSLHPNQPGVLQVDVEDEIIGVE